MGFSGGKGKNNSFSLPTLIEKQKGLSNKLKKGLRKMNGPQNTQKNKEKGGKTGDGEFDEQMNGELFKIYQEQSQLRKKLEEALGKLSKNNITINKVLKTMEQLENAILEKGFSMENIERMQQLEYQLLKLDNAYFNHLSL